MSLFGTIAKLGGGILGQALSAKSTKKALAQAAAQQTAAINAATDLQRDQFNRTEGYLTPYMTAGTDALGGMRGLLGLNGAAEQESAIGGLKGSPLYESLYRNGEEALLSSAAATGGLRGGNTQRSLANFGRDTLASVIQQQLSNLGGLTGQGLGAAGSLAGVGANTANNLSDLAMAQGNVNSGLTLNRQAVNNNFYSGVSKSLGGAAFGGLGGSGGVDRSIDTFAVPGMGGAPTTFGGGGTTLPTILKSLLGAGGLSF